MMRCFFSVRMGLVVALLLLVSSCSPKPSRTVGNLKNSVERGFNASLRYRVFSACAGREGYAHISNMFEALAKTETILAENQLAVLKRYEEGFVPKEEEVVVGTTLENLKAALEAEGYEAYTVYPIFGEVAVQEKAGLAQGLFVSAEAIAKRQISFLKKATFALEAGGSDRNVTASWAVCPECGCPYMTTRLQESCVLCPTPGDMAVLFR